MYWCTNHMNRKKARVWRLTFWFSWKLNLPFQWFFLICLSFPYFQRHVLRKKCIQSESGKIRTRKTPIRTLFTHTFYVILPIIFHLPPPYLVYLDFSICIGQALFRFSFILLRTATYFTAYLTIVSWSSWSEKN